ncbi:MAG: FAD-linked oxidase C-terminal domain-containing protein, partial [Alphaproteobacteria bacterium]|nr:FAD-linked oxidase C-terminal domain-containing protein [Alphaproteobacteria bacterium]
KTGGRAKKSSAGYDLTRLLVGAEGTLGIITEIQLRLFGIPETIMAAICQFPDLESAVNTTILTIQSAIPVARIELLDDVQMGASINYSKLEGLEPLPTLFIEFHGSPVSVKEQVDQLQAIATDFGGQSFQFAEKVEDRNNLWKARHHAYYAARALAPGKQGIATDACVPISQLTDCILETREDIDESNLLAPIVGHVGDGNFHMVLIYDPENPDEKHRAESVISRLNERAISMGGTCTGEHGIGLGKIKYMRREHGDAIEVMRLIKASLDPKNIMNPGKILPAN